MEIIYGLNKVKKYRRPVVALGVFDGVHCGHRHILQGVVRQAHLIHGTAMMLTFWPHPQKKESLYSLEHRLKLVQELGVDVAVVISFTEQFSRISSTDFIKDVLVKRIGAEEIYVGRNFRFGRGAAGDVKLLKSLSLLYNHKVRVFEVIKKKQKTVSSTYIRQLITKGDLSAASALLARPVTVLGTVVRGDSQGRKLGFPTANINPHHEILPPSGIYAVRIKLGNRNLQGICYVGRKPTFKRCAEKSIEVHIFNFKKKLYAKNMEIQFLRKIREDKKFSSKVGLVKQIKKDIIRAKRILSAT